MNKFFNNIKSKILTMSSVTTFSSNSGFESDDAIDTTIQNTYQNSLYVSRALEIIQDVVAGVDIELYKITSSKGKFTPVEVSPIIDLIYKPNALQTKSEFWKILVVNYKLSGEAFIRVIREEKSKVPTGLINLNPRDMEVELTEDGQVKYKYSSPTGIQINYTQEEVFHIKNPNPNSQLRGFGILRPLVSRIDAEIKSTEYQANLFGRNGNPDGLLVVKGVTDVTLLGKVKAAFYNSFRGKNESNRIAVVGGEASYTPLQSGTNSLDFIASKNNVRDEVFMALGVPKSMITSDDVNRANADAGLQQFMQFTIAPMFKMILEVFNERFIAPNFGEEFFLDTEKLVTEDKDQLLKEAQTGVNKWLTVNEVRERYGYEPLDGGDVLNTSNQVSFGTDPNAPVLQNAFKTRPKLYQKLLWTEKFMAYRAKNNFAKATANPIFKVKFSSAMETVRSKGENLMRRESKLMFKEQKVRVLAKLQEVGDNITTASDIFDHKLEKKQVERTLIPVYTNIATSAGNMALLPVKAFFKTQNFVMNSVLFKQLEHRANLFSEGVTDTTYAKISEIVADKMNDGVPAIASALTEMFDTFSDARVNAIARTESCYMTSLGSQMAYQESDVVEGKEWLSTGDDRVRDEHVENDGQIVGVNDAFSNGEHFPAENSINCRCALAPVVLL